MNRKLQPFKEMPEEVLFYKSSKTEKLLNQTRKSISDYTLIMITGLAGIGKSLLLESILNFERKNNNRPVYLMRLSHLNEYSFLCEVSRLIGGYSIGHNKQQIYSYIFDQVSTWKRQGVLMVDDAHLLSSKVLSDLKMLYNHLVPTRKFKLLLCGQHNLKETLSLPLHQDFFARFRRCYSMEPYSLEETKEYIKFQLKTTKSRFKFTEEAINQLHNISAGLIRNINIFGDNCLIEAEEKKTKTIDESILEIILEKFKMR